MSNIVFLLSLHVYTCVGDLYFDKLVDGFLKELFHRWGEVGCNHEVTLAFFWRVYYQKDKLGPSNSRITPPNFVIRHYCNIILPPQYFWMNPWCVLFIQMSYLTPPASTCKKMGGASTLRTFISKLSTECYQCIYPLSLLLSLPPSLSSSLPSSLSLTPYLSSLPPPQGDSRGWECVWLEWQGDRNKTKFPPTQRQSTQHQRRE